MTKKHKCDRMVTVGTETNTKTKNQIPKSGNRKEKFKERINKNMSVLKFNTTRMMIPPERDGKVDDKEAFERQMRENEEQLRAEIKQARQAYDDLPLRYEESPRELVPNRINGATSQEIAERAQDLLKRLKNQEVLKAA